MAKLSFDIDAVISGQSRLTEAQALELHRDASLHDLGQWAHAVTQRLHPEDYRTYVIDRNINYTNVCTAHCTFCAFRRDHDDADSYTLSYAKIGEKISELVAINGTQILMQGGMNDALPIECRARFPVERYVPPMTPQQLAPGLLLAAPSLGDQNFERSVVLLGQHDDEGAVGWVLNGVARGPVREVLTQAQIARPGIVLPSTPSYLRPVRVGGPVLPGSAWLLFRDFAGHEEFPGEISLGGDYALTCAREAIDAVARGDGPESFWMFLGYAGWGEQQLESEIQAGAWLPASLDVALLELDADALWDAAYRRCVGASPMAFTTHTSGSN